MNGWAIGSARWGGGHRRGWVDVFRFQAGSGGRLQRQFAPRCRARDKQPAGDPCQYIVHQPKRLRQWTFHINEQNNSWLIAFVPHFVLEETRCSEAAAKGAALFGQATA